MTYWHMALTMCRAAGVGPSLLLHPLDLMGCEDDRDLAFFPAMGRPAEPKVELVAWMIDTMKRHFEIVPMKDHAAAISSRATQDNSRSGAAAAFRSSR